MKFFRFGRLPLLGCSIALAAVAVLAVAFERRTRPPLEGSPAPRSTHTAGRILYVDPETGERTAPPPAVVEREAARRRAGAVRADTGLVKEPLPGGGFRVDLQGRFQTARRKIVQPDGTVQYACEHGGHEVVR